MSSWKEGGLNPSKYIIFKEGGEPVSPDASYFVLRYDTDPHARKALIAYAESVAKENKEFSDEIYSELESTADKFNKNKVEK